MQPLFGSFVCCCSVVRDWLVRCKVALQASKGQLVLEVGRQGARNTQCGMCATVLAV
jgi:bacterioferritin-associated ferredoxin